MSTHFQQFTAEAMQAFRKSLNTESQRRTESLNHSSEQTSQLLAGFRQRQCDTEAQRRQHAADQAARRRQFLSQLRSRVQGLRGHFEQRRQARADDRQEMHREFRAASGSFRDGTRPAGHFA